MEIVASAKVDLSAATLKRELQLRPDEGRQIFNDKESRLSVSATLYETGDSLSISQQIISANKNLLSPITMTVGCGKNEKQLDFAQPYQIQITDGDLAGQYESTWSHFVKSLAPQSTLNLYRTDDGTHLLSVKLCSLTS